MVSGKVRVLGNVINELLPGTIIYTLGSTEPMVVTMIFGDKGLITNSAGLLHQNRLIRTNFEWVKEFDLCWKHFLSSSSYALDIDPYCSHFFRPGGMVIIRNDETNRARVEVMAEIKERSKVFITEDKELIPFAFGRIIFDTGVTCYLNETNKPAI